MYFFYMEKRSLISYFEQSYKNHCARIKKNTHTYTEYVNNYGNNNYES